MHSPYPGKPRNATRPVEKWYKSYAVITNCLARLSKSALEIEKFEEDVAEQRHQRYQAKLDKNKPRGISPETLKEITEALNLL